MQDVLKDHAGIFWMDASVRFKLSDLEPAIKLAKVMHGIQMFVHTGHSSFAVTDPGMYKYIVTDIEKLKEGEQLGATGYIIYRTKEVWENVLKWGILCSLTRECIAPTMNNGCGFPGDRFKVYANCHRFDQSLTNILIANYQNFDWEKINPGSGDYIDVVRGPSNNFERKQCNDTHHFAAMTNPDGTNAKTISYTTSAETDGYITFAYHPAFNKNLFGKEFHIPKDLWNKIEIHDFVDESEIKPHNVVFVCAASRNHFQESLDAVASAQHWFPRRRIIYYDIEPNGLSEEEKSQVHV